MYGFGRGRGFGRGMGFGLGRGAGFGFRGASPPWPYVGIGRGGLPRCGYFFRGVAAYPHPTYGSPFYGRAAVTPGYVPYAAPTSEDEIGHLRDQAEAIRAELDSIESRMRDLGGQQ
ncbi:MAG: DUF5320 family protein [Dehalococcoidia bacterium]|nr:DUF5320 family protein [Dehalococcoidia bacterium]